MKVRNMMLTKKIVRLVVLALTAVALCACQSSSTRSSTGSISGPPSIPGSVPTGSSPATGSDQGQSPDAQLPTQGRGHHGQEGRRVGKENDNSAGKQSGEGQNEGSRTEGKTDDEILAEALKAFDKSTKDWQQPDPAQQAGQQPAGQGQTETAHQRTMTQGEHHAQLDNALNERFTKFDELMRGERQKVARRDNEDGVGGYGSDNSDYADSEGDPLQTALIDDSPGPPDNASEGDVKGEAIGRERETKDIVRAPPPPDVGDGRGDDVIARQLREAAMKEQDPELRERLWDEYRKYKGGAA
mgnify:CR=1 FL=1